jgi:hypothetical protein
MCTLSDAYVLFSVLKSIELNLSNIIIIRLIFKPMKIDNDAIAYPAKSLFGPALSNTVSSMAMSNDILFK